MSPTNRIHKELGTMCRYHTFGMDMPGRSFGSSYDYNFNGKLDDKWDGNTGNYQDFGARIYDSRLGRFMSLDMHKANYPSHSPFSYASNDPVSLVDTDGNDWDVTITKDPATGKNILKLSLKAAVIITAKTNMQAATAAKVIASNLEMMIQQTAAFNNIAVVIDVDIRGIKSTAEIQDDDHVIELVNPSEMPSSSKGIVRGEAQLYGKYVALDVNTIYDAQIGSNIKTIPHELFHTAGLRHVFEQVAEDDYKFPLELAQLNYQKEGKLYPDEYHGNLMNYQQAQMPQVLETKQLAIVLDNYKKKLLNVDNVPKTNIAIRNIGKLTGKMTNHKIKTKESRAVSRPSYK